MAARRVTRYWIGIGGNVGDVRRSLRKAVQHLMWHPAVHTVQTASLYKSPPWGLTDQPWFFNSALVIETNMNAVSVLREIKKIERKLKRRKSVRWGPRTVDLDIIAMGKGQPYRVPHLVIPHARAHLRSFVLKPLLELDAPPVIAGRPIRRWLQELDASDLEKIDGPDWAWRVVSSKD